MISKALGSFWREFNALDPTTQKAAQKAYAMFADDPGYPSLRFKKLNGFRDVWSVRVTDDFRAVGTRSGDVIEWFWIGSHRDFDALFR